MAKIKGTVTQFGTKGYGFIKGDDGEKYFVHQKNIYHQSRLAPNTRVIFKAQDSEKGWVAVKVVLEKSAFKPSTPLSNTTVKILFTLLFIAQIMVMYQVFIKGQ